MSQYIFYKRRRKYFVWIEFLLLAMFVGASAYKFLHFPQWAAYTFGFILLIGVPALFFWNKICRYVITILFSSFWGFLGLHEYWSPENKLSFPTIFIFSLVLFLISLWVHWDFFDFLSNAEVVEYD